MKRQLIQFGVIIGVLLLCAGGYFLMTNYFADKKAEEEKADTTQAFKIDDYTKITGITYSYNDEMIILLKEGDKWILGENNEADLDESIIEQEMLIQLSQINSETVIENPKNIADYGFEKDKEGNITAETTTIIAMDSSDKAYTIYIGASNPYDTAKYYMMVENDDNVYVIDSTIVDTFSRSATDLEVVEETTTE